MKAVIFDLDGTLLDVREEQYLKLYEGVDELLPILKAMGVQVAALTYNGNGLASLERVGILGHFDVVITAEQIINHKPHPEGVLLILEKLGAQPHEVVIVGDTASDILAGKNAGLHKTIGVAHGFDSPDELRTAGADHVVFNIPSVLDVLE